MLVVLGELDGEKFAFFVNHWPSRRSGEAISLPKRNAAAALLNQQMDSIRNSNPEYRLMAMGDFNDDPVSPSFKNYVKATGDIDKVSDETPYFNPMFKMFKNGSFFSKAYPGCTEFIRPDYLFKKNLIGDKGRSAQKIIPCIQPKYMLRDTSSIKKEATKVILSDHGTEIDLQEDTVTISRFSVFCKKSAQ